MAARKARSLLTLDIRDLPQRNFMRTLIFGTTRAPEISTRHQQARSNLKKRENPFRTYFSTGKVGLKNKSRQCTRSVPITVSFRTVILIAIYLITGSHFELRSQNGSTGLWTTAVKVAANLPGACNPGEILFLLTASPGQNVYGCASSNQWVLEGTSPQTPGGPTAGAGSGPGSGPIVTSSQLADLAVTQLTPAQLGVGPACTTSTPCAVRFGTRIFVFNAGANISLASGSGLVYIYVSFDGTIVANSSTLSLGCQGCAVVTDGLGFPGGTIPLATWTAAGGQWNTVGGTDFRAFLNAGGVAPGLGLVSNIIGSSELLAIDPNYVAVRTTVPGSSASTCQPGMWAADQNYFYLCVASNMWKRLALMSW